MFRSQCIKAGVILLTILVVTISEAGAQLYIGSTPPDTAYMATRGLDVNGRATIAGDYGWTGPFPFTHTASGFYPYGYYPNASFGYVPPYEYGAPLSGYSGGFATYSNGYGYTGYGSSVAPATISRPRGVIIYGNYNSRTVMNNSTRGAVKEYTYNGNGYVSNPGSTYQTVIQSGPSIFPYTTVIQPTQPPVVIDSRKSEKTFPGNPSVSRNVALGAAQGVIQLVNPKESTAPISYMLNGTTYSIKPGYTQTFPADRPWNIEFFRQGSDGPVAQYALNAGTYRFIVDINGLTLVPDAVPTVNAIPPSPAPPAGTQQTIPSNLTPPPSPSPGL